MMLVVRGTLIHRGSTLALGFLMVALASLTTLPSVGAEHDTDHCINSDPLDVGLVIDRSGSMGTDRMETAKDGADLLVQELDGADQSGLVSYSTSATHDKHIDFDHAATRGAISALGSGGLTATGDAIALSHNDFQDHARWGTARPVMILLTDGYTNNGVDPVAAAQAAKDDGIEIFAMGVGSGVNEPELKQIASDPSDAYYYRVADGDEVLDAFREIADRLNRNDLEDPTVETVDVPSPGHLYVDGVDHGPGSALDPAKASVVGKLAFQATFHDDCQLDFVDFTTTPQVGWSHTASGSDVTTTMFPCDEVPPGDYMLEIEVFDWVGKRGEAQVPFECAVLSGRATSIGVWAGATVPASVEYQSTSVYLEEEGSVQQEQFEADFPSVQVYARGVEEAASSARSPTTVANDAMNRLAEVDLLGGLVRFEGLTVSGGVEFDLTELSGSHQLESRIDRLVVAGEEVSLDPGPQQIDLPDGLGFLYLHETTVDESSGGVSLRHNLVHAYLELPYGRAEVILGGIVLQAGLSLPSLSQSRAILSQDDAGSGGDAGDAPGGALPIATGLHHGSTPPGDLLDYYRVDLEHGQKINLALQPAPRTKLTGGGAYVNENPATWQLQPPGVHLSPLERYELRLFDPVGDLREDSTLAIAGVPQRIELNADQNGPWIVEVRHLQPLPPLAYNYTLGVSVTPVPLLPDEDLFNGPEGCVPGDPSVPEIITGMHPKTMQHGDFVDVYRFEAGIGDLITLSMKPGETLDGWSAALSLLDKDCALIERLDTDLLDLKGVPKVITRLPSQYTGDYFVKVDRLNGVGNYYLGLTVTDPFPKVPVVWDGDQPEDHEDAQVAPPVFFQGELPDDDPGDAYLMPFEADKEAFVVVKMSAASNVDVKLYRPDGTTLVPQTQNVLSGQLVLYRFEAPVAGDYGLEIRPTDGGGTYGVGWGQAPVENV